ncbi:choice-of-anchor R domain-containing protein [Candidatus Poriferisodalis sp.]|uniref:choice-of-anchor R domain-containing protein n=1 Tax=Candidatus Poriferisodalis sp. TaxID=3101277 RepID=UPI003B58CC1B
MMSNQRISSGGSALGRGVLFGLAGRGLSPRGIRVALAAMMLVTVLAVMALWSAPADADEPPEPLWSADMTVSEYSSVSIGAASADLFSDVGGSGDLQIRSLWSYIPGRDLRLAFEADVADAADYTLQVGDLSLEFPHDSSGASSFKWYDVDVDWQDGQVIRVRIVRTADIDAVPADTPVPDVHTINEALTSTPTQDDLGDDEHTPQVLVANLGVGVSGSGGIQRTLGAARSGFAQAFTTGTNTGGYALGAVGIQVSSFPDASSVGDHLGVTVNSVASDGEPGDALCTLTDPSTFTTPGVIAFDTPTGESACPQLATETTYFVVIEWTDPSGTEAFALIPQTYPTEDSAATEQDPGSAQGWSIADNAYYLTVNTDTRTWTAYDETASFKIKVTGTISEQTTDTDTETESEDDPEDESETETETDSAPVPFTVSVTAAAPTTHNGTSEFTFDLDFSENLALSYKTLRDHAFNVTGGSVKKAQRTDRPSNISWRITVKPDSTDDVTVVLPIPNACDDTGAICTDDDRKLSNRMEFTVSGPDQ